MTTKAVAEALGCDIKTVLNHAKRVLPDKVIEQGKPAYWNEAEVTIILESIMAVKSQNETLKVDLQSTETPLTPALKAVQLGQTIMESWTALMALKNKEIESLQQDNKDKERLLEAERPKVDFYEQVMASHDAMPLKDAADVLKVQGLGQQNLFKFLRGLKVLDARNVPYRRYQDKGYFVVIETPWRDRYGETHLALKTLATQKGLDYVRHLIANKGRVKPGSVADDKEAGNDA
jgi:phage antirepressor YoqD-like protein